MALLAHLGLEDIFEAGEKKKRKNSELRRRENSGENETAAQTQFSFFPAEFYQFIASSPSLSALKRRDGERLSSEETRKREICIAE